MEKPLLIQQELQQYGLYRQLLQPFLWARFNVSGTEANKRSLRSWREPVDARRPGGNAAAGFLRPDSLRVVFFEADALATGSFLDPADPGPAAGLFFTEPFPAGRFRIEGTWVSAPGSFSSPRRAASSAAALCCAALVSRGDAGAAIVSRRDEMEEGSPRFVSRRDASALGMSSKAKGATGARATSTREGSWRGASLASRAEDSDDMVICLPNIPLSAKPASNRPISKNPRPSDALDFSVGTSSFRWRKGNCRTMFS